ncbi:peptidoglycan DD-metalloendopeptidase family protein [Paenibacillus sp. NPDC057967]|uniref:peptidoglycan DD-metalloendopeptidase family protein n=1 Tax=Paenibacillus sp. NPDC057967 TaxID=3346293 RepID=UPI0036DF58EE
MNDQNQNKQKQRPEESPKNSLGGASAAKSSSGLKKLFAKRWVSPAIFMAAAAIIVTLMWIYQGSDPAKPTTVPDNSTEVAKGEEGEGQIAPEDEVDVVAIAEDMKWPVASKQELQVETKFYDEKASETEKEAALVQVGTTYSPHTGIDFVDPSGQPFDVLAALNGKVTRVEPHPLNGNVIEISHGNGLVTVYQSLTDVQVEEGDEVSQGTVIAQAGRSDLERELGIHLHFETRLNGKTVNPSQYISE